jgi:hypothetical protein
MIECRNIAVIGIKEHVCRIGRLSQGAVVESSRLCLALGVKRNKEGVGPRCERAGDATTGLASVAHLGPLAVVFGGEAGTGVCSGRICSTPSSSSSSLRVRSITSIRLLLTGAEVLRWVFEDNAVMAGEALFRARDDGAGLARGLGSDVLDMLFGRGVAFDVRGRLRIRSSVGSGAGVKQDRRSGLTGGGDGEGRRRSVAGGEHSSCNSLRSSDSIGTPGRVTRYESIGTNVSSSIHCSIHSTDRTARPESISRTRTCMSGSSTMRLPLIGAMMNVACSRAVMTPPPRRCESAYFMRRSA